MKVLFRDIALLGEHNNAWAIRPFFSAIATGNYLWEQIAGRWLAGIASWGGIGLFYLMESKTAEMPGLRANPFTYALNNWNNELYINLYLQTVRSNAISEGKNRFDKSGDMSAARESYEKPHSERGDLPYIKHGSSGLAQRGLLPAEQSNAHDTQSGAGRIVAPFRSGLPDRGYGKGFEIKPLRRRMVEMRDLLVPPASLFWSASPEANIEASPAAGDAAGVFGIARRFGDTSQRISSTMRGGSEIRGALSNREERYDDTQSMPRGTMPSHKLGTSAVFSRLNPSEQESLSGDRGAVGRIEAFLRHRHTAPAGTGDYATAPALTGSRILAAVPGIPGRRHDYGINIVHRPMKSNLNILPQAAMLFRNSAPYDNMKGGTVEQAAAGWAVKGAEAEWIIKRDAAHGTVKSAATGEAAGQRLLSSTTGEAAGQRLLSVTSGKAAGQRLLSAATGEAAGQRLLSVTTGEAAGQRLLSVTTGEAAGQRLLSDAIRPIRRQIQDDGIKHSGVEGLMESYVHAHSLTHDLGLPGQISPARAQSMPENKSAGAVYAAPYGRSGAQTPQQDAKGTPGRLAIVRQPRLQHLFPEMHDISQAATADGSSRLPNAAGEYGYLFGSAFNAAGRSMGEFSGVLPHSELLFRHEIIDYSGGKQITPKGAQYNAKPLAVTNRSRLQHFRTGIHGIEGAPVTYGRSPMQDTHVTSAYRFGAFGNTVGHHSEGFSGVIPHPALLFLDAAADASGEAVTEKGNVAGFYGDQRRVGKTGLTSNKRFAGSVRGTGNARGAEDKRQIDDMRLIYDTIQTDGKRSGGEFSRIEDTHMAGGMRRADSMRLIEKMRWIDNKRMTGNMRIIEDMRLIDNIRMNQKMHVIDNMHKTDSVLQPHNIETVWEKGMTRSGMPGLPETYSRRRQAQRGIKTPQRLSGEAAVLNLLLPMSQSLTPDSFGAAASSSGYKQHELGLPFRPQYPATERPDTVKSKTLPVSPLTAPVAGMSKSMLIPVAGDRPLSSVGAAGIASGRSGESIKPIESPRMISVPEAGRRAYAYGSLFYHSRETEAETSGAGRQSGMQQMSPASSMTRSLGSSSGDYKTSFSKVDMNVKVPQGKAADGTLSPVQLNRLVDEVYQQLEKKVFVERRRMGL